MITAFLALLLAVFGTLGEVYGFAEKDPYIVMLFAFPFLIGWGILIIH